MKMKTNNKEAQEIIDNLNSRNNKIEERKKERESIKYHKKIMEELGITVL